MTRDHTPADRPSGKPAPAGQPPQQKTVEKIIVAVHGIGEQVRSETIQAVANQFCRYCGLPASMPLGRFTAQLFVAAGAQPTEFTLDMQGPTDPHSGKFTGQLKQIPATPSAPGAFLIKSPPDPEFADCIQEALGFGEVYWADIPRGPARDRYTLEEAKKWARTVVERVRALEKKRREEEEQERANAGDDKGKGVPTASPEYALASQVIEEMIETTRVLSQLLFLAEKVTPFRFTLDDILVNYLGDVQIVAEFENYRTEIVGIFQQVMAQIAKANPEADIYIVAHSEGTVITLLGLLKEFHRLEPQGTGGSGSSWAKQIRGLMTIGAPIDKHFFLWPHLWDGLGLPAGQEWQGEECERIPWRNYFDYGDPIGYRLDRARQWLKENGWGRLFNFEEKDDKTGKMVEDKGDIAFTRYPFAGKAHTDYWQDEEVFGHFIQKVVQPTPRQEEREPKPIPPPGDSRWALVLSPTLPYLVPFALLLLGVYLVYRAFSESLNLDEGAKAIGYSVLGIGGLLAGLTAAVRIPRLTRDVVWRRGGLFCFFAGVAVFLGLLAAGHTFEDRIAGGIGLVLRDTFGLHFPPAAQFLPAGDWAAYAAVCLGGLLLWLLVGGLRPLGVWPVIPVAGALLALLIDVLAVPVPILVFLAVIALGSVVAYVLSKRKTPPAARLAAVLVMAVLITTSFVPLLWPLIYPLFIPLLALVFGIAVGLLWQHNHSWGVRPMIYVAAALLILLVELRLGVLGHYEEYQVIKQQFARTGLTSDQLEQGASAGFRLFAESDRPPGRKSAAAFAHELIDRIKGKQAAAESKDQGRAARSSADRVVARLAGELVFPGVRSPARAPERGSVWPVFVAGAVFLYLWWLAAMCFDLLVAWNYYIRESGVIVRLKELSPRVRRQSSP